MSQQTRSPQRRGSLSTQAGPTSPPGDRLERWFVEMLPVVHGYCRARVGADDAEDVTSEVFGAAAEQLRRDPDVELTRSWFITTAHNRVIDRWRKDQRWRRRMPVIASEYAAPDPGDADAMADSDALTAALDQLPDRQRAVLILFYVEDRSVREIAGLLERSPTAIDSLLARARRSLLELVGDGSEDVS